jgi:branched-chain amino acid transport system substrate-binding protein
MRITFASLPFEKMKGVGATTYDNYKKKYGKEPTGYALYSAEAARVALDGIKRAAAGIDAGANPMAKREAVRAAIAGLKNFDGLNGKFSFDENGDTTLETMSGFKVVKSDKEPGCTFAFESILE